MSFALTIGGCSAIAFIKFSALTNRCFASVAVCKRSASAGRVVAVFLGDGAFFAAGFFFGVVFDGFFDGFFVISKP